VLGPNFIYHLSDVRERRNAEPPTNHTQNFMPSPGTIGGASIPSSGSFPENSAYYEAAGKIFYTWLAFLWGVSPSVVGGSDTRRAGVTRTTLLPDLCKGDNAVFGGPLHTR